MNFERIVKSITNIISLNESEIKFFTSELKIKHLNRKELLLESGHKCKYVYFINQGALRYYYLIDGEEKTGQFFFENEWYTDYESFLSGDSTENYIDALENTELLCLERDSLLSLYSKIPKFERFGRIMAEKAYLGIRRRTKTLTNLDAEARYLKLLKERPEVFERVSQHNKASYLNIKPQSLSRIRKKIIKKNK